MPLLPLKVSAYPLLFSLHTLSWHLTAQICWYFGGDWRAGEAFTIHELPGDGYSEICVVKLLLKQEVRQSPNCTTAVVSDSSHSNREMQIHVWPKLLHRQWYVHLSEIGV